MSNREGMIIYLRDLQQHGLLYAHHNPEDWDDETLEKMCLVFHPVCIRFMRRVIKVIRNQDSRRVENPESPESSESSESSENESESSGDE